MVLKDFDQQTTFLVPDLLAMKSPLELAEYEITEWKLVYYNEDRKDEGLKMEVTLRRILANELLTTYLPSFFLIGICYSTTFYKQFYFEAAVTVNLTVMLVATTLFIR